MMLLSAIAAGWGNSLDPISALSFVSPALAMGSLARLMPPEQEAGRPPGLEGSEDAGPSHMVIWVIFILVQSLGFVIGFGTALVPDMVWRKESERERVVWGGRGEGRNERASERTSKCML